MDNFIFKLYYQKNITSIGSTKIIIFNQPNDNTHIATIKAKNRDFATMSSIIDDATYINHVTGSPFLRTSILYHKIIKKFIEEIVLEDEDPPVIYRPFENDDFTLSHYILIKEIAKIWLKNT